MYWVTRSLFHIVCIFFTRVKVGKKFAIVEPGRSLILKNKKLDKSTCFNSTIVEINIKHHIKKNLDLYLC